MHTWVRISKYARNLIMVRCTTCGAIATRSLQSFKTRPDREAR